MKTSNVKHPIQWRRVCIDEIQVDGDKIQLRIDIQAPKDGLYLVTVDPDGKELGRVQVPTQKWKAVVLDGCGFPVKTDPVPGN